MAHAITIGWDASPTPGATYNVYRGTAPGNESPIAYATGIVKPAAFALTSVTTDGLGHAEYIGTVPTLAGSGLDGMKVTISGFVNAGNNGTFLVLSSTPTQLIVSNANYVAESASASAQLRPYFIDLSVVVGQSYSYEITAVVGAIESVDSIQIQSAPVPFAPSPAKPAIDGAASFEVLAGSTATNTGTSSISGDVGVWPGTSITGFGPPTIVSGAFHSADFVAQNAQASVLSAYNDLSTRTPATTIPADIGGLTFGPGVYNVASSLAITGNVTLDGGFDPNAVFIFQIGSTLTTASSNSGVRLANGAQADNVWWVVGSSATLNTNTDFAGNILAQASISVNTNVVVDGRLFAISGAVTLDADVLDASAQVTLISRGNLVSVVRGQVFFDSVSQSFQEALNSGVTASSPPAFSPIPGVTTQDGGVTWLDIVPAIFVALLPSPPNTPPPPPAAPTNPSISNEE